MVRLLPPQRFLALVIFKIEARRDVSSTDVYLYIMPVGWL